jgi:DNA-binding transcriptional LysR family regulator
MDTAFLRTFLLVAKTGSMAEAARRLDLSPTSVSQQLKALEREFGSPLIARSGRTVQLTDIGHQALEGAKELLRSEDALLETVNGNSLGGTLKLGSIHSALHTIVPNVLMNMLKSSPNMHVVIEQDISINLYDAVQSGDLDGAFCIHPAFSLPKTMGWRTIRREALVVLAPQRLAKIAPNDLLRRFPLIRYGRTQWGGRQAERYLRSEGITPIERLELTSITAIAMMVDRGLGVALVPDTSPLLPGGLQVAKLPVPDSSEERRVGFVWSRSSARQALIKALLKSL